MNIALAQNSSTSMSHILHRVLHAHIIWEKQEKFELIHQTTGEVIIKDANWGSFILKITKYFAE